MKDKQWLLEVITNEKRMDEGVELRTITIVGTMGSGKSTMAKHLVARAYRHLTGKGYDDSQILALHFDRSNIPLIIDYVRRNFDLSNVEYLYLINDDASYLNISRGSLSYANVESVRQYIAIRHRFADMGFDGVLIVFHLTQMYYLLDKALRDSYVLAFKSISKDPTERDMVLKLLGGEGLNYLISIHQALSSGNREQFEEAIKKALVLIGSRIKVEYDVIKEEPPESIYYKIDEREINDFVEDIVGFTCRELEAMLRACEIKFRTSKLGKFVKMLNYAIARKFAGGHRPGTGSERVYR